MGESPEREARSSSAVTNAPECASRAVPNALARCPRNAPSRCPRYPRGRWPRKPPAQCLLTGSKHRHTHKESARPRRPSIKAWRSAVGRLRFHCHLCKPLRLRCHEVPPVSYTHLTLPTICSV
eukprot:6496812-Prymnesium_polylepis.2